MNEPTVSVPELSRCPRCQAAAEIRNRYVCTECGMGSPRWSWQSATGRFPIQPEEANGGRCERCGETVDIHLADEATAREAGPRIGIGVVVVFLALVVSNARRLDVWTYPTAIGIVLCLGLIVFWVYRSHGGRKLARSILVVCHGCGFVRVAGRADEEIAARYWRGRSAFVSLARWSLAVVVFFAVVTAGSYAGGEPPDPMVILTLGLAAAFWLSVRGCIRTWPPRRAKVRRG